MTDWKAKYLESELARAKAVEALKPFADAWEPAMSRLPKGAAIYHRTDTDPDKSVTILATAVLNAHKALSAQPPNDVAETLREIHNGIQGALTFDPLIDCHKLKQYWPTLKQALAKLRALMGDE